MVSTFEDFCTWVYVVVDDSWKQLAPLFRRPGPEPRCADSELLAMALIGECRGWDVETELLSHFRDHRDLFPVQPSQSRFNRRRRALARAFLLLRQLVLRLLDLAQDRHCALDSLPVPVVRFHLVPGSGGDWDVHGAAFGVVPSKKQTIYGYKLHLLVTFGGVILDFHLAGANEPDPGRGPRPAERVQRPDGAGGQGLHQRPGGRGAVAAAAHPAADAAAQEPAPAAAAGGGAGDQLGPADHRDGQRPVGGAVPCG